MLIRCEFITSCYVAKETHDEAEWPPHPARLFYALVSSLHVFDSEEDKNGDASEREALEWLQRQGNPEIYYCSIVGRRDVVEHHVPANDMELPIKPPKVLKAKGGKPLVNGIKSAINYLPDQRTEKHERTFPTLLLPVPANMVYFQWANVEPSELNSNKAALETLMSRVSYLGHSSSAVSLGFIDKLPEFAKHSYVHSVPTTSQHGMMLRGIGDGLLKLLEKTYLPNEYSQQNYRLPHNSVRYVKQGAAATEIVSNCHSHFGEQWIVYRFPEWARVPLTATLGLTSNLKTEACRIAEKRRKELPSEVLCMISGHSTNGKPIESEHVAWLALPWVSHPNANGLVFGLAAVPPRRISEPENRPVAEAIMSVLRSIKTLPFRGSTIKLKRVRAADFPKPVFPATLRPLTWCGGRKGAQVWATVTPMALDRFPGFLFGRARKTEAGVRATEKALEEAKASIRVSCRNIGLPEPDKVFVSKTSWVEASPPIRHFAPQKARIGKPRPVHAHVKLIFSEKVSGPILLGRSRYLGYGLFRPLHDGKTSGTR